MFAFTRVHANDELEAAAATHQRSYGVNQDPGQFTLKSFAKLTEAHISSTPTLLPISNFHLSRIALVKGKNIAVRTSG